MCLITEAVVCVSIVIDGMNQFRCSVLTLIIRVPWESTLNHRFVYTISSISWPTHEFSLSLQSFNFDLLHAISIVPITHTDPYIYDIHIPASHDEFHYNRRHSFRCFANKMKKKIVLFCHLQWGPFKYANKIRAHTRATHRMSARLGEMWMPTPPPPPSIPKRTHTHVRLCNDELKFNKKNENWKVLHFWMPAIAVNVVVAVVEVKQVKKKKKPLLAACLRHFIYSYFIRHSLPFSLRVWHQSFLRNGKSIESLNQTPKSENNHHANRAVSLSLEHWRGVRGVVRAQNSILHTATQRQK